MTLDNASLASELCAELAKGNSSLRKAASRLGMAVNTAKSLAARQGIKVKSKPKVLSAQVVERLCAALRIGSDIGEIALAESLSASSIYRILQSDPELCNARSQALLHRERLNRRARFLKLISTDNGRVINARKAAPKDYAWLLRHDRNWLQEEMLRLEKPPTKKESRVDWEARDQWLYKALNRAVQYLLRQDGRPIRITAIELGRRTGKLSWIEKCLSKLPDSARLLTNIIESTEAFQSRRIIWAMHRLLAEERSLYPSSIARLAGIRSARDEKIAKALANHADFDTRLSLKRVEVSS